MLCDRKNSIDSLFVDPPSSKVSLGVVVVGRKQKETRSDYTEKK